MEGLAASGISSKYEDSGFKKKPRAKKVPQKGNQVGIFFFLDEKVDFHSGKFPVLPPSCSDSCW